MSKASEKEELKKIAIKSLRKLGVKPGSVIYTIVTGVSRSGMSRTIRCYVVTRNTYKGDRKPSICYVTGYVGDAIGYRRNDNGDLVVGGCGMDMCFHVVYCLGRAMFPQGGPLSVSPRKAQEERNGETIETDGGYLLRKENL